MGFQQDEEEILKKMGKKKKKKKKPGFWSRMWNGAKKIGGKVVAGVKHVGKKVVAGVKHVGKKVKGLFSKKKKEETTTTTDDEDEDKDKKEETTSTTTTEEDEDEDEPTPTRRATRRATRRVTTKIGEKKKEETKKKESKKARYELYADACKSATTKKSECNILTFNDLVDKGYKTKVKSAKRTRVACVWKRDACRPKVKRKTNLRANTPMKFGKEEAPVLKRL